MFAAENELTSAEQWSGIRRNADYQRAFDETMTILLADIKPLETVLSVLERPRVAQKNEGTSNAV